MRHLAWLHAVPEGSKKSRLASLKQTNPDSSFLQFPEIDGAEYIVALLQEAGLMSSNGMGAIPLTWQEIESWLNTTELALSVWEKITVKELSEIYVGELNQASAKDCAAPYVAKVEEETVNREAVASKLKAAFQSFKRSKS